MQNYCIFLPTTLPTLCIPEHSLLWCGNRPDTLLESAGEELVEGLVLLHWLLDHIQIHLISLQQATDCKSESKSSDGIGPGYSNSAFALVVGSFAELTLPVKTYL